MHRDGLQGGTDLGDAREAVASAAEECEASCLHAIGSEGRSDGVLRSIAAVASITAERARLGEPRELTSAVSLCARMIEAAAGELVGLSELPAGLEAAAAEGPLRESLPADPRRVLRRFVMDKVNGLA